jgi:hypothetical protein
MRIKCPYCGYDGVFVDEDGGECQNSKCGGYFNMKPEWQMNTEWEDENE